MTNTYIHTTAFFCSQRLSALAFKHTWGVNPQSLRHFTARFVFNLYIHFSRSVTIQRNLSTYSRRWTLHHLVKILLGEPKTFWNWRHVKVFLDCQSRRQGAKNFKVAKLLKAKVFNFPHLYHLTCMHTAKKRMQFRQGAANYINIALKSGAKKSFFSKSESNEGLHQSPL